MTAARRYRSQLTVEDALAECRAASGTQFWSAAVYALARVHPGRPSPVRASG